MEIPNEKQCKKCLEIKPLEDFNCQKAGKYGRRSQCKLCQKAESDRYLAENGDKVKQKSADRRRRMAIRDLSSIDLPHILTCSSCGADKPPSDFHNNKFMKYGKVTECKECVSIRDRQFRENNSEKTKEWDKNYRENNADSIASKKKKWKEENREIHRERAREYHSKRRKRDIDYRLKTCVRSAVRSGLLRENGSKMGESTFAYLPYTPEQLKIHIENQFEEWMNWDNWGVYDENRRTWQIDHIYPQSLLPYDSLEHENFGKCWALENLRPLETIENIKKSNKIK